MNYYTGSTVKNYKQILLKLRFNQKTKGYYLVCLEIGPGLLAILSTKEYINHKKNIKKYKIIGIAKGKHEAECLVLDIITDYYKLHQDFSQFKTEILKQRLKQR